MKKLVLTCPKGNYSLAHTRKTLYLTYSTRQTQLTLTCSKSTTETLEKGVKYVQS